MTRASISVPSNRLVPLEAYRGIAALIVLIHHFLLGFSPYTTGYMAERRSAGSLIGQPYFFLFNGYAAVMFFFTLSGFVLCWSFFNHEQPSKITSAFLKRLPRLAGIITITTVASYILYSFNGYFAQPASRISGSPWLGDAVLGESGSYRPSLLGAIYQGLTTCLLGSANYNTNLWTMQFEFYGSLLVYLLAAFLSLVLRHRYLFYTFVILAVFALAAVQQMLPFIVGVFLSALVARRRPRIGLIASVSLIAVGLYLLGYRVPERAYRLANSLPGSVSDLLVVGSPTAGSALIIFATMCNRQMFGLWNGRFSRWLGKMSFPFYLVQIPVLGSASSYLYLRLVHSGLGSRAILCTDFTGTIAVSLLASIPLSRFDDWWVRTLNRGVDRLAPQTAED